MKKQSTLTGVRLRDYCATLPGPSFPTLLHLVEALFAHHAKGTSDHDAITRLLDALGYHNLGAITPDDMPRVHATIRRLLPRWTNELDPERQAYNVMAAIVRGDVTVFIDDAVVTDLEAPIRLGPDPVLAFIDHTRIASTSFQIL
ncbi:MAG: hypothetical protein JWP27_1954 [Flaviaesturariibacter sp.]|nr:hypothetical protein [Flaviaesturariibacter sp.]